MAFVPSLYCVDGQPQSVPAAPLRSRAIRGFEMTHNILAQQMRAADIFDGLRSDQLVEIAMRAGRRLFREGDCIAKKGARCAHAIIIVDGTFRCTEGVGAGRDYVEGQCGTVIGEMAMFLDDFEHAATYVAASRLRAMQVDRETMLALMARDPDMARRLVDKVASRLRAMTDTLGAIRNFGRATAAQSLDRPSAPLSP